MTKDDVEAAMRSLEATIRSLEATVSTIDTWVLVFAALVAIGVLGEAILGVAHWQTDRSLRPLRVAQSQMHELELAQLNNETASLRAMQPLVTDALKSAFDASKSLGLTTNFLMRLVQALMTVANPGIEIPGFLSPEQQAHISSKTERFAGTKFDAEIDLSSDVERLMLEGSLIVALEKAGWVKVSEPLQSKINAQGVVINFVTGDDPELLNAAVALASALNAEGIAATVDPKTETDITASKTIHILVGPPQ
jgi:hypothetical protein